MNQRKRDHDDANENENEQRNSELFAEANKQLRIAADLSRELRNANTRLQLENERLESANKRQKTDLLARDSALANYHGHVADMLLQKRTESVESDHRSIDRRATNAVTAHQRSQFLESVRDRSAFRSVYDWGAESANARQALCRDTYGIVGSGRACCPNVEGSNNTIAGWNSNVPVNANGVCLHVLLELLTGVELVVQSLLS